jgi:hypothetical protein
VAVVTANGIIIRTGLVDPGTFEIITKLSDFSRIQVKVMLKENTYFDKKRDDFLTNLNKEGFHA